MGASRLAAIDDGVGAGDDGSVVGLGVGGVGFY